MILSFNSLSISYSTVSVYSLSGLKWKNFLLCAEFTEYIPDDYFGVLMVIKGFLVLCNYLRGVFGSIEV